MVFKKLLPHLATRGTYSPGDWRCDEAWHEQTLVYPAVMGQQRLIYCTWELNVMICWNHYPCAHQHSCTNCVFLSSDWQINCVNARRSKESVSFATITNDNRIRTRKYVDTFCHISWRRHAMGTLYALPVLCKGIPPVTGGSLYKRPVKGALNFVIILSINKFLKTSSNCRWLEKSWRVIVMIYQYRLPITAWH